jgi:hypothetical protein
VSARVNLRIMLESKCALWIGHINNYLPLFGQQFLESLPMGVHS